MEIINQNPDCGIITIFIHNTCNFKCSYCSPEHYGGKNNWPQNWDNYLDLIDDLKEKNKYVYIEVSGGEPTLWPKFQQFVEHIVDDTTYIEFDTNGSRTNRYWESFKPMKNVAGHFSWHGEFVDDEHYLDVLEIMQDKVACTSILMMVPETFDRARRMYDRIVQRGMRVEIIPKYTREKIDRSGYFSYPPDQHEWISGRYYNNQVDNNGTFELPIDADVDGKRMKLSEMINQGLYKFEGWTCTAGQKRLFVNVDGEIYRCSKFVGGSLGNINNVWMLPNENVICDTSKDCTCKFDTVTTRWK